jgi:hypothetical protein
MGVTIHFEGCLRDEAAYENVIQTAKVFAAREGWGWQAINEARTKLERVRDEKDWDYVGPTRGIVLHPHEDSEPLRLEFDASGFVQEFIKTQFAPAAIHIIVVELLHEIAPHFLNLTVEDEGEYWESRELETLDRHRDACFRALDEMLAGNPRLQRPVHLSNCRIVDFMEP